MVSSCERRLIRANRFTDRFFPNRLRRVISKNARGANSSSSTATPPVSMDSLAELEPAAVADRRRRRFLDRDEQIPPGLVAVGQLRDPRAAEQAERGKAALRLDDAVDAERIARLDLQLALDRFASRVRSLPTTRTCSTKIRGPSRTRNTTSARVPSPETTGLPSTVAFRNPRLAYRDCRASRSTASWVAKNSPPASARCRRAACPPPPTCCPRREPCRPASAHFRR